jgi:hopanoid biosynthesis associated RND transporter like protein HpnN
VAGVNVGLTGEPVLDYDEMQQSQHDSTLASIVSLIICSLIFIYAYREAWRPLKAVACLILGLGYTMGFTTLTVGHLNILTITFAPILIGLAIDFGIHFITRYEEEMRRCRTIAETLDKAMVFTGQGIVTGALTTAGAFLAMALTDFKGIQEMGIISGGGLVLCLVPMMTLLPILLMHGRQNALDRQKGAQTDRRARIEELWLQRPLPVAIITLALCGAAATQFHKVYFDYNLLHMQSQSLASVVYEKKLLYSGQSILFGALEADSIQQARQFEKKARQLSAVTSVDGDDKGTAVFELLTSDQSQKLHLVRAIKDEVSNVRFARIDTNAVRLEDLGATLYSTMAYCSLASNTVKEMQPNTPTGPESRGQLTLAANTLQDTPPQLGRQLGGLHDAISDLRVKMFSGDPAIPDRLLSYQEALFHDVQETFEAIKTQDTATHLRPEDLPAVVHNRFIGVSGKRFRVLVFPKNDIWRHDVQQQFVSQLRSVVPEDQVTGTPVQLLEYTTLLKDSYVQAAWYALAAIGLMVLFHFRSLVCVILALLPVAIGTIWMVGIMGLTGIPFNPANIMTLPLVIGIGVTNGIHILNRFAEEQKAGILAKSTGKAVLVSGLTAMTGFGSLILAQHEGIRSLGLVMSLGIATCMLAGLTFLPALLNSLVRLGWTVQTKRPSTDNARPLLGLEEPR